MPATSPSTTLYSLGKGILSIGEWEGATAPTDPGDFTDVGNCPEFTLEVTEEKLDHFSSRAGTRKKDKVIVLEAGYTIKFKLDEISLKNLQMFLRATLSGSTILLANTQLDKEYGLKFVSDNPVGPNLTWAFWRVRLMPDGAFNLISDAIAELGFTGEGLADETGHTTSPFFTATFATTTTTTTT